jgi:hypothetical protein
MSVLAFGDQRRRDPRRLSALIQSMPGFMLNSFGPKGVPGVATNFNSPNLDSTNSAIYDCVDLS